MVITCQLKMYTDLCQVVKILTQKAALDNDNENKYELDLYDYNPNTLNYATSTSDQNLIYIQKSINPLIDKSANVKQIPFTLFGPIEIVR